MRPGGPLPDPMVRLVLAVTAVTVVVAVLAAGLTPPGRRVLRAGLGGLADAVIIVFTDPGADGGTGGGQGGAGGVPGAAGGGAGWAAGGSGGGWTPGGGGNGGRNLGGGHGSGGNDDGGSVGGGHDGGGGGRNGGGVRNGGGGWNGGGGRNGGGGALAGCRYPAQVLDLADWKLTLPTGSAGSPKEITQPSLATFTSTPYFRPTSDCRAVTFRAPVDGVTTSGSSYPRSELREMTDGGSAGWSSSSGTHTMTVTEAFTRLPEGKPQVVGAQIHDAADDISVFRLEGSNLYVTDGDNPHYKLVTSDYRLGTPFRAAFVVSGGTVKAYYDNQLQATLSKSFSGAYFKAGAYTQANCQKSAACGADDYGETTIFSLEVSHR